MWTGVPVAEVRTAGWGVEGVLMSCVDSVLFSSDQMGYHGFYLCKKKRYPQHTHTFECMQIHK